MCLISKQSFQIGKADSRYKTRVLSYSFVLDYFVLTMAKGYSRSMLKANASLAGNQLYVLCFVTCQCQQIVVVHNML